MNEKVISILGSTGSIGTQALEVCQAQGFEVCGLAANRSVSKLEEQIRLFHPKKVCIYDESCYEDLKQRVADCSVEIVTGMDGLCELASMDEATTVLNSVVGMIGLQPTLAAIEAKKDLALANKETLVTGGKLVLDAAKQNNVPIYPVDSEHSAIFQSLQGNEGNKIEKILLTASGGPFYGKTREELQSVTVAQALNHPNWSMGAKITTDSATLMNKGLEFIEAMWLFDLQPDQIEIVVHRESVIHSAVEFEDHAVIAQLGAPDMKIPIQYALTYPARKPCPGKRLNIFDYPTLSFAKPDEETFRCLKACKEAIRQGGILPTVVNGANEQAVALFLDGKISFLDIGDLVWSALQSFDNLDHFTLQDILETDQKARAYIRDLV